MWWRLDRHMYERWLILAVLTFARIAMGFQFQSVSAAAHLLVETFHTGYTALGMLIGLYVLPGIDGSRCLAGVCGHLRLGGGHVRDLGHERRGTPADRRILSISRLRAFGASQKLALWLDRSRALALHSCWPCLDFLQ